MTTPTESRLGELMHELASEQPFTPDVGALQGRARRQQRRSLATRAGAGVAAAVALAVGITQLGGAPAATSHTTAAASPLLKLSSIVAAADSHRSGDATLVIRTQDGVRNSDLFADDGDYFYAMSPEGLPRAVQNHENVANGVFSREQEVGRYAVDGDLTVARQRMAEAALDPGNHITSYDNIDNLVWINSFDGLSAGSGDSQVRAGILRILSTIPDVKVTSTTVNGRAALTLTAGGSVFESRSVSPDKLPVPVQRLLAEKKAANPAAAAAPRIAHQEVLTIDATNGQPISYQGGEPGKAPDVTMSFSVRRVTLADVAAGRL